MKSPEYEAAALAFEVTTSHTSPGVAKVIAEAGVGWVCEVVVSHVPDSRSRYEYLVSVLTPRQRAYGVNTLVPHDDYLYEKFVMPYAMSDGEFALLAMTIREALRLHE